MPSQHYTVLRSLASDGRIRSLEMEAAGTLAALQVCGLEEVAEPRAEFDQALLEQTRADNPGAFLSLRCRTSWPLEEAVKGMHRKYHRVYGLELAELAGFALDDVGHRYPYQEDGRKKPGQVPFPVEVVRSWDHTQAGLPHWARRLLEARNDLKCYLKQQGILLIGDWALLADCSGSRVREAMELNPSSTRFSAEEAVDLHSRYLPLYKAAKLQHVRTRGRQRGWLPDDAFLHQLEPQQPPRLTREQLEFIAAALRCLVSGQWQREEQRLLGDDGGDRLEGLPDPGPTPWALVQKAAEDSELASKARRAFSEAGEAYLKQMLQEIPLAERDQQLCFWGARLEGKSTRQIAEHCNAAQARVARRLRVEHRAAEIATEALRRLRADPDFEPVFRSPEQLEAAAERLVNHLLRPEQQGSEPPLRQMLRTAMVHQSTPAAAKDTSAVGARP